VLFTFALVRSSVICLTAAERVAEVAAGTQAGDPGGLEMLIENWRTAIA